MASVWKRVRDASQCGARSRLAAWPGTTLVGYAPTSGLVREVFPGEDGHAQARSLFGQVLETGDADDLWSQDRNVCPCAGLCGSDSRGAGGITRQHAGLPFEGSTMLRPGERIETGQVAAQRVQGWDAQGHAHLFWRIRVQREQATREGERVLYLLPTLPLCTASAKRVARLSRTRWPLETAFQHLAAYSHSEIHT